MENAQTVPEKVHSQRVQAGKKIYFFDVKKASNGSHYLTITESYPGKDGKNVYNRLLIFKDNFADFKDALSGVKEYLQ